MCCLKFQSKILVDKMVNLKRLSEKIWPVFPPPVLVTQQGGRLMKAVWFTQKDQISFRAYFFPRPLKSITIIGSKGGLIPENIFNLVSSWKKSAKSLSLNLPL